MRKGEGEAFYPISVLCSHSYTYAILVSTREKRLEFGEGQLKDNAAVSLSRTRNLFPVSLGPRICVSRYGVSVTRDGAVFSIRGITFLPIFHMSPS